MDNNKAAHDKVDELLESTSEERRFKLNFAEIESILGTQIKKDEDIDSSNEKKPKKAVQPPKKETKKFVFEKPVSPVTEAELVIKKPVSPVIEAEPIIEEPVSPVIEAEPVIEELVSPVVEVETVIEEPVAPVVEVETIIEEPEPVPVTVNEPVPANKPAQAQQQKMCIIDETSTSVVIEQGPDISVNEIVSGVSTKKAKEKKPKEPLKLKPIQIVIMALVGLVALWTIMYTVDHTLAANGISPVFSRETETYADGSASYKGLGYKVQFKFDSQGNLTQQVCPFWQEGPNDIVEFPGQ